ncbi:hypothetical protein AVEN_57294-1 [Araneus ventricosus]|uniref:Uncharacterized protein n=1 Tax=Araneus ventricosus TaxID=182803 RepID=A0A4Y2IU63_ARAVE|nr:hypothetical protein AVEN_57294-1 [Araneus ventricosus]
MSDDTQNNAGILSLHYHAIKAYKWALWSGGAISFHNRILLENIRGSGKWNKFYDLLCCRSFCTTLGLLSSKAMPAAHGTSCYELSSKLLNLSLDS